VAHEESLTTAAVDVVVVSYNSREHIRASVETLAYSPDVHVIVVDNASPEETVSVLHGLPVDVVQLESNDGFARGCNEGWRRGEAPLVLFLNPDAQIDPESLRRLVAALSSDSRIGIVGPKICYPDGSLHFSLRYFPRVRSTFAQAFFLHRILPRTSWTDEVIRDTAVYERPGPTDWISGACMLVRRSVLERLEGLDEGFFLYSEDTDLCKRARDAGYQVRFEPDALAVHVGGASAPRPTLLPVLAASRLRYAQKHATPAALFSQRVGLALGALIRAFGSLGKTGVRTGHSRALRLLALGSVANRTGRPS
jgi:N-acetylglucosaminyl-diphospho-decaprenol L-rhamnosyltransferase